MSLDTQIKTTEKHLNLLKALKRKQKIESSHNNPKFVVLCGAEAHFHTWGNHDMTTSVADKPNGTESVFYCNIVSDGFYDTFSTMKASVNKDFVPTFFDHAPSDCIIFTKAKLNRLYAWLAKQPWGDLLVKSAKDNTFQLSSTQIHNIKAHC